ncbi:D-glycerate dehydrogenase [Sphingomonas paucimobilis]|uniref:D-glycerate dehydrogenase n=2 Tax=Sphingomonas paucimobilis TaxID=13689 RepID=A0A411LMN4_SPHPI|nr:MULTISPECIES: D-glycerate dehydrogenase [Sphingomonas]MBQ1480778.1 D-glycerate dehydrogenase [Sphingomonas sp.]MCM3679762.1 D-glycerate dehydrogenase [Sphingomonas paucimobilis]MDG5970845.1 D-glycerate dehydrogenase [Sphingomonas paucimobilis]NNG56830.1 D-glycerate dehydrogenase [Sphingomonas paucimobilis]QBE93581.1 D-glycerate dehydrogenase [Sphingomonas paucimobilis]
MVDPRRCLNPRVVVTRELPDPIMERMAALFDTHLNRTDEKWSQAQLAEAMATCDVLVPTVTDSIDAGLIAGAGPRLKLIANFGAGVNHIDLKAARARGIIVTNTPGVLTEDTADMTMALILSVPRRLAEGEKLVRSGAWKGWSPGGMLGHRIGGKALGIVGMGRIGQAVARRARAFGLSIHYHNRRRLPLSIEAELNAQWYPDLDAMLGAVDIVSIHTPLNADSHDLIDRRRIGLMRAHVYLINASRGGIVDEDAMVDALEAGRLAGAGLDVWRHEPQIDPRLLALPNVVLTPHMGSATLEGRVASGEKVIANIRSWADGHRPPDQVLEGWL